MTISIIHCTNLDLVRSKLLRVIDSYNLNKLFDDFNYFLRPFSDDEFFELVQCYQNIKLKSSIFKCSIELIQKLSEIKAMELST